MQHLFHSLLVVLRAVLPSRGRLQHADLLLRSGSIMVLLSVNIR